MSQIIAFDFGLARIGVAVGQGVTQTASPLETLPAKEGKPDWTQVEKLLKHWQPSKILIGEPLNMDGSTQEITQKARKFANQIHGRFGYSVEMVDERLSSFAARDELFELGGCKKIKASQVDSIAAVLILESWFSRQLG